MRRRRGDEATPWRYEDEALFHTATVLRMIGAGKEPPSLAPTFAMLHASAGERLLASSSYALSWFGAVGDGSYGSSVVAFGGPLMMAATLGASAVGNSNRRRQAALDATPMWRPLDSGALYVSTHALYFDGPAGWRPWAYGAIDSAHLRGRCSIEYAGRSDDGASCRFWLNSAWAELAFALWAVARGVEHPDLHHLFPLEWQERLRASGRDLPGPG